MINTLLSDIIIQKYNKHKQQGDYGGDITGEEKIL